MSAKFQGKETEGMNRLDRKIALQAWLMRKDVSHQTIADALGISRQRVSIYLGADNLTQSIWERFVKAGVPADLLPEPRELHKRGPRARTGKLVGE